MNIPRINDIDTALFIYYSYPEIGTKEIETLFVPLSKSTISRLKKVAFESMVVENVSTNNRHKVNTDIAYKAWGINITDLEQRREKLQGLGLK